MPRDLNSKWKMIVSCWRSRGTEKLNCKDTIQAGLPKGWTGKMKGGFGCAAEWEVIEPEPREKGSKRDLGGNTDRTWCKWKGRDLIVHVAFLQQNRTFTLKFLVS